MNTIAADLLARYERGEICKPCDKALAWLGDRTDMRRAWHDCPRGDWMLWIAQELGHRPPVDWVARESVSYAFGYAAESLDCVPSLASYAAAMRHHRDALRTATPATAGDLLRAAADAAAAAADAAAADAAAARAAARAAALAAARAAAWAAAAAGVGGGVGGGGCGGVGGGGGGGGGVGGGGCGGGCGGGVSAVRRRGAGPLAHATVGGTMIDTAILALLAAACFVAGVWLGTWVFPLLWHARARRRLREIEELRERWRVER